MVRRKLHGLTIECTQGDIANQPDVEAVVNAANAELRIGGGVAGALHRAAGPGLEAECRPLAPIRPGEAVITTAHNLPNSYVIHCLGPVYGYDEPSETLLTACYRNALRLADDRGIATIAFPAISTGAFGYPAAEAARVAFGVMREAAHGLVSVRRVRFVLFDQVDLKIHIEALQSIL